MERYVLSGRQLGEGNFGSVIEARFLETGRMVALKRVPLGRTSHGLPKSVVREHRTMQVLTPHPHIVHLYEVFPHGNCLVFSLERCDYDLAHVLTLYNAQRPMPHAHVKSIFHMLLVALDHCHVTHRILHRDVKPTNIMFRGGYVKLGDFGLARPYDPEGRGSNAGHIIRNPGGTVPEKSAHSFPDWLHRDVTGESVVVESGALSLEVATRWYRAPELLLGSRVYGPEVDMWSAGCVLAELLTHGSTLFAGMNDIDQLSKIFLALGTPTEDSWPSVHLLPDWSKIQFNHKEAQSWKEILRGGLIDAGENGNENNRQALDLLSRILTLDPSRRYSAREAMNHPYFSTSPFPTPPSCLHFPEPSEQYYPGSRINEASNFWRRQTEGMSLPSSPTSSGMKKQDERSLEQCLLAFRSAGTSAVSKLDAYETILDRFMLQRPDASTNAKGTFAVQHEAG